MKLRGLLFGGLVLIGGLVFGFMFLLRGCLSQYDERSAQAPLLYFNDNNQPLVLSIVKFEKATSYQRSGGFVNKSVSVSYYLQTNDATTGKKINEQRIMHHSDIKQYPVELIAAAGGHAWMFMGKLMKFDPYTLEKKADIKSIEALNPHVKGKLPEERKFYEYNEQDSSFRVTLNDGSLQHLNTSTLKLTPVPDNGDDKENSVLARLERHEKENQRAQDSLMENKLRRPSRLLSAREISMSEYQLIINGFNKERSVLYAIRDSLQALIRLEEKKQRSEEGIRRTINNLKNKTGLHYTQIRVNADTLHGQWFGLYTVEELRTLPGHIYIQAAYADPARRQLYTAAIHTDRSGDAAIAKDSVRLLTAGAWYLNGGFLLDRRTGLPQQVNRGNGLLILHREKVGNDANIMISRVDRLGVAAWTINSDLKEWADWQIMDNRLIILGRDHKELSGDQQNILLCIELASGKISRYDYFSDK